MIKEIKDEIYRIFFGTKKKALITNIVITVYSIIAGIIFLIFEIITT